MGRLHGQLLPGPRLLQLLLLLQLALRPDARGGVGGQAQRRHGQAAPLLLVRRHLQVAVMGAAVVLVLMVVVVMLVLVVLVCVCSRSSSGDEQLPPEL